MVVGFLIEDGHFEKILISESFRIILKYCWIMCATEILINLSTITIFEPNILFNAFDCSFSLIPLSVLMVNHFAKLKKFPQFNIMLKSKLIAVICNTHRVSYLIHPLILMIFFSWLQYYESNSNLELLVTLAYYFLIYFTTNLFISIVFTLLFSMPLENLANHISEYIFKNFQAQTSFEFKLN